ncbi:MAG: VWA domain-containing protein [Sarcina sp.]
MKIGKTNVEFLGQKVLPIEGREKTCNFYSLKSNKERLECVNHHVLLVDVSESMRDNIENLKKSLKETLKVLRKEGLNYVSIILYSDDENVEVIAKCVKCDDASYRLTKIYKNINANVYARENTTLSSALKESKKVIKSLKERGVKHHILLFSDGYISNIQNQKEEKKLCFEEIEALKEDKISISTIGFGGYYDRDFLREIAARSYNGRFNHISDIKDYHVIAATEIARVNNSEAINLEVTNSEFFIQELREVIKERGFIKNLNLRTDNIIVVFDEELVINDKKIKVTKKAIKREVIEDFSYSFLRYYVENDNITGMEEFLDILGDQYAYDKLINCNSFIEKGSAIEFLENLINDKSKRFKLGKKETKIKKDKEAMCLLELLHEIINDDECKLLWDYSYGYKRIGVKENQIEDTYKFQRPKIGFGEVTDLTISDKKLNIGVRVKIKGNVQNQVNKLKLDACIYRDYKLVVDGNINTDEIWCILSKNAKSLLRKEKLLKGTIKVYDKEVCVINLKDIKLTNKRVKSLINENTIAKYLYDIEVLRCEMWALNKFITEIFSEKAKIQVLENISFEELETRKLFRVDNKGVYAPLKIEYDLNKPYEFYISKAIEWKIEKFPRAKERKAALDKYKVLIVGEMNESYKRVLNKLEEVKKEKKYKQFLVNMVRISNRFDEKKVFIWDTITEKKKVQTDPEFKKNMIVGGIVKVGIKELDGIKIREDFYEVINKYN